MEYHSASLALLERIRNDEKINGETAVEEDEHGPVTIFDSTLRDGAQGAGVTFSLEDKLQAVRLLDQVGVQYVEAGNPGSNPKDAEFFQRAAGLSLKNARLVSFGSTRRKIPPQRRTKAWRRCWLPRRLFAVCLASAGNSTWTGCWKHRMRKISG